MRIIFTVILGSFLPICCVGVPDMCPPLGPPLDRDQCEQCCHCIPPENESCPDLESPRTALQYTRERYPQFYNSLKIPRSECYPVLYPLGCQPFPAVAALLNQQPCEGLRNSCSLDKPSSSTSSYDSWEHDYYDEKPVCALDFRRHCNGFLGYEDEYQFFCGPRQVAEKKPWVVIHHEEECGVCSFAQDLAANMNPSLDCDAFKCTLEFQVDQNFENLVGCYSDLGFTSQCAFVWASNAVNTILAVRFPQLPSCQQCASQIGGLPDVEDIDCGNPFDPNVPQPNDPETCNLSPCILCDEEASGPIFAEYAGLTRRRAGIVTATDLTEPAGLYWVGTKRDCDTIADIQLPGTFDDICAVDGWWW